MYNTSMKSIMIRNVPEDLHKEFKILCVKRGVSINKLMLDLMRKEVDKEQKK
jgi:plasmid stability protein